MPKTAEMIGPGRDAGTAKERPIIFSAPMVRAILADTKTMTRRVVKPQPAGDWATPGKTQCPHGQPGDRLYIKETFYAWGRWETRFSKKKGRDEWHFIDMTLECGKEYRYAEGMAGGNGPRQRGSITPEWWKRPAIFMPRWASRITLEITAVRVERLQDISEKDARAEGVETDEYLEHVEWAESVAPRGLDIPCTMPSLRGEFHSLWDCINGLGSWDENPYIWVIEFKRV